jgi:predicted metal-dependent phosphoesterase TrpH
VRIDLHTHSNRSDGTDDPAVLVEKARTEAQLDVVALTDHDATTGWGEAQEAADRVGIRLVRGIEISTKLRGVSVHLLGYEFDPDDPDLVAELDRVLAGRTDRLPRILELLSEQGMPVSMADVEAQSGSAAASGRPHVADALVAAGHLPDRDAAFDGWLNAGGRAYVPRYSAPLERAIELVKAAGGRAVVAHPWSRGGDEVLRPEDFARLVEHGLDGIEVDHHDHDAEARTALRRIAADLDLVVTGSSDHHGTGKGHGFHLGSNTTAPDQLERLLG